MLEVISKGEVVVKDFSEGQFTDEKSGKLIKYANVVLVDPVSYENVKVRILNDDYTKIFQEFSNVQKCRVRLGLKGTKYIQTYLLGIAK